MINDENDELAKATATLNDLADKLTKWKAALQFYANAENWETSSKGFAAQYDPVKSAIREDGGEMARKALGVKN